MHGVALARQIGLHSIATSGLLQLTWPADLASAAHITMLQLKYSCFEQPLSELALDCVVVGF